MNTKKQGLQKLTETDKKINCLFAQKKILKSDARKLLNDKEMEIFTERITKNLNELKGIERDIFFEQIDELLPKSTKNQIWENNHLQITISISKQIEETGKMPTKNQIAEDSGLSRQTVYKHLSGYAEHPLYNEQIKQFKFMSDRVLAKVIKLAAQGDVKAARLYFDVMGNLNRFPTPKNTLIQTQNNNIQINGTVLSQETIKYLNPEQLNMIEGILNAALPQPKKLPKNP